MFANLLRPFAGIACLGGQRRKRPLIEGKPHYNNLFNKNSSMKLAMECLHRKQAVYFFFSGTLWKKGEWTDRRVFVGAVALQLQKYERDTKGRFN